MNNSSNNRNNIVGGEEECNNIGLELGLGMMGAYHYSSPPPPPTDHDHKKRWSSTKKEEEKSVVRLDLSFTLCPKQEEQEEEEEEEEEEGFRYESMSVDPEEQEMLMNKNSIKSSITTSSGRGKKLRLTKDQSSLLEHTFKLHSTLNPAEKQELAEQLNLKPRQVEVWFQNRRARTKLKQTEVDCEFLKKCCEKLSSENKRLKKELQELRALKIGRSGLHHVHFAKDTTTRAVCCSSCERSKC